MYYRFTLLSFLLFRRLFIHKSFLWGISLYDRHGQMLLLTFLLPLVLYTLSELK